MQYLTVRFAFVIAICKHLMLFVWMYGSSGYCAKVMSVLLNCVLVIQFIIFTIFFPTHSSQQLLSNMPIYFHCRPLMNPSIDKNTMQSFLSESEVYYMENGQGAKEVDDFSVGSYCNNLQTGFEVKYLKVVIWRPSMMTSSALLGLCAWNSPVPVNSSRKGQWRGSDAELWCFLWSAPESTIE